MRTASIIVEHDLRGNNWSPLGYEFVDRFASVLPRDLIDYIFLKAIHLNKTEIISRIAHNDIDLFVDLDNKLQVENSDLRMKAIHTELTYANILLGNKLSDIVGKKSSDFGDAVQVFDLLNSEQRSSILLFEQLCKCFDQAQNNCKSIEEYRRNKDIFFRDVLKIQNGYITNPSYILGGQTPYVWSLVTKYCPMEYAINNFLDIVTRKDEIINEFPNDGAVNYSRMLKSVAIQILKVDIDERIKDRELSGRFSKKSESSKGKLEIHYPRKTRNLEYVSQIIKESINSPSEAKAYIDMFAVTTSGSGYETPDALIMQKIVEEYGNEPSIKEVLLKNCIQINRLWEAIPYSSVPDEYTEYEKLNAATQILICDIDRIDEIPEDIKKKIFSSKDLITRILFPGYTYAQTHETAMNETTIAYTERGIKNGYLLTKVLMNTPRSLIDAGFLEDIRKLYDFYTRYRVLVDNSIDISEINKLLDVYSYKPHPVPLSILLGIVDPNQIDFATEGIAGDENEDKMASQEKKSSFYSLEELEEAKKLLTFDEAIKILSDYYFANRNKISDYISQKTSNETEENVESKLGMSERTLGREVPTLGMGDYLRRAAIFVDDMLFNSNNLSEKDIKAYNKFVAENGDILPKEFINAYSTLMQSKEEKQTKPLFNPLIYKELVNACRKYCSNLRYHNEQSIDIDEIISILNSTYYEEFTKNDMNLNGFIFILLSMVLNYAGEYLSNIVLQYMEGQESDISEDLTNAHNKAVSALTKIGPDPDTYNTIFEMHNNFLYPIDSRLLSVMMEISFGSNSNRDGVDDYKKIELRDNLTKLITQKDDPLKEKMLMQMAPDDFLKWSRMDFEILLQAMMIAGRNDVEVISTLNDVVLNDRVDRIRAANPGLSEEELISFKKRLSSIREKIYDDKNHEYMILLIGGKAHNTEPFPTHKQEFREYFRGLVEPLNSKQFHSVMMSSDLIKILGEEMRNDIRVAGMNQKDLSNMLTDIWKEKADKEKQSKIANSSHNSGLIDPQ